MQDAKKTYAASQWMQTPQGGKRGRGMGMGRGRGPPGGVQHLQETHRKLLQQSTMKMHGIASYSTGQCSAVQCSWEQFRARSMSEATWVGVGEEKEVGVEVYQLG